MSVDLNRKILDASKLTLILDRLASQLFENHKIVYGSESIV